MSFKTENFESMRSPVQDLTFTFAKEVFERHGIELSQEEYLDLGMVHKNEDFFTNLALLMSDQCRHTTKIAVFADETRKIFRDSKEFGGSIFKQLDDVFQYLMLCNRTTATFKGLERIEKPDYPEAALREALLNALVHRDYSFSGSIIINVNDDKMEFISIGGLLPGLSADDIRLGISQPRNKNLAEVFHRLRLIESYGTGIRRIYKLYENCAAQPIIEATPNAFKIVLPNMNAITVLQNKTNLTPQKEQILDFISRNGQITEAEIMELLGVKRTRAYTLAKQMCDENLIISVGRGVNKKYLPKE